VAETYCLINDMRKNYPVMQVTQDAQGQTTTTYGVNWRMTANFRQLNTRG